MNTKSLLKKLKLSDADFDSIKETVASAEKKTSGEIAVAVAPESGHYSFWELLFSIAFGAILVACLIPLSDEMLEAYQKIYWNNTPVWIIPLCYLCIYFFFMILAFYICNIPAIDRIIIPRRVMHTCVSNRAFRHFTQSGVYATESHSGVLIFVSYLERQVRIIADKGLSQKISSDMWNLIADELADNIKSGNSLQAITTAVSKCGELLEKHFPASDDNPDELPNGLVILEDSECM